MFGMTNMNHLDLGFSATGLDSLGVSEIAPTLSLDIFENKMSSLPIQQLNEEERMQMDKKATLSAQSLKAESYSSLNFHGTNEDLWLETNSNLQEFFEMADVEEVKSEQPDEDDYQSNEILINEMEEWLSGFESSNNNSSSEPTYDDCPLESTAISDSDKDMAEQLIDELFLSTIQVEQENQSLEVEDEPQFQDEDQVMDSGFETQLEVQEYQMGDVIIVIAPDSYSDETITSNLEAISETASISECDSDAAWSPGPSTPSYQKRSYQKKYQTKKPKLAGVDKKERKKKQNVEAARRYRDKKKNQQQLLDEEMDELSKRNSVLRDQVSEKENELKTLKKLMIELGLVKIGSKI